MKGRKCPQIPVTAAPLVSVYKNKFEHMGCPNTVSFGEKST